MNIEDIKKPENIVYKKSALLTETPMHYCPGCSHGTVHKLVAEVIEEMGIQEETIAVSPVGCSVFAYNYIDVDWQQAAHGRAPAVQERPAIALFSRSVFTLNVLSIYGMISSRRIGVKDAPNSSRVSPFFAPKE